MYTGRRPIKVETSSCFDCGLSSCLCLKKFCSETSIHGFNHIGEERRHPTERLIWFAITLLAIVGAVYISYGQWQRFNDNPTVVILEKDFRNWNFSFPAITICFKNNVDKSKSKNFIQKTWGVDANDERWEYYSEFVSVVASSSIINLQGFKKYINDDSLDNLDLYKVALEVVPKLDVKMTWHDSSIEASPQTVMTEAGVCYVINSLATADILVNKSMATQHRELITCQYKSHVCYLRLEMQNVCVQLSFHSPYDTAELALSTESGSLCFGTARSTELSGLDTRAALQVKDLSLRRRGCLFLNEPINPRQKVYSNNMCRRSCRNRLAINLCGCQPYFNEYEDGKRCDLTGLVCLSKYSEELKTFHNKSQAPLIHCDCVPQCEDSVFLEINTEDKQWKKSLFSSQASVKYNLQAPRTRYKRVIVFYFQDLVVSLGGAAGLFLGASFLSFVEIIYFIIEAVVIKCWSLSRRNRYPTQHLYQPYRKY